jgi:hypothetical protein
VDDVPAEPFARRHLLRDDLSDHVTIHGSIPP